MPPRRLENDLRLRARERIREGRLPCVTQYRTWGGRGDNQPCALCDAPIGETEVEYEIEALGGDCAGLYRFHFVCHDAWQYECAHET